MTYINQREYYTNNGVNPTDTNWGSYQYISLDDLMTNFELMYEGNHSLVNNENRYKILFHTKRAIQELNYDAFKEIPFIILDICFRKKLQLITYETDSLSMSAINILCISFYFLFIVIINIEYKIF